MSSTRTASRRRPRQSDAEYDARHDAQYDVHPEVQQIARGLNPVEPAAMGGDPQPASSDLPDARPLSEDEVRARIAANPVEGTPAEMREAFARLTGPAPELGYVSVNGVRCAKVGTGPRKAMWLHGGGYVFGSPETHAHAARTLAERMDGTILIPDYPLAPEAVWPVQEEAVRAVLDGIEGPLAVVGDSSGGHLALRLALTRPGRISALALISPNTDRTGRSGTRKRDTDLMNDDAQDNRLARMVLGDRSGTSALMSPVLADLTPLPPLQIHAASDEILLDDAAHLARSAGLAGVAVDLRIWPGLFHMWHLWPEALPEARATLEAIAHHLRRALPTPPAPFG